MVQGVVVQIDCAWPWAAAARAAEGGRQARGLLGRERKADIDGDVGLVGVLDLGLGQRRAAVEAPVDRLQATDRRSRVS
jgi:hypothetical protein